MSSFNTNSDFTFSVDLSKKGNETSSRIVLNDTVSTATVKDCGEGFQTLDVTTKSGEVFLHTTSCGNLKVVPKINISFSKMEESLMEKVFRAFWKIFKPVAIRLLKSATIKVEIPTTSVFVTQRVGEQRNYPWIRTSENLDVKDFSMSYEIKAADLISWYEGKLPLSDVIKGGGDSTRLEYTTLSESFDYSGSFVLSEVIKDNVDPALENTLREEVKKYLGYLDF